MWNPDWVGATERKQQEWLTIYGSDKHIGWNQDSTVMTAVNACFVHINHLMYSLFIETLWYYIHLVVFHFNEAVDWLRAKFYSLQNMIFMWVGIAYAGTAYAFDVYRNSALLGRGIAALCYGFSSALTSKTYSLANA